MITRDTTSRHVTITLIGVLVASIIFLSQTKIIHAASIAVKSLNIQDLAITGGNFSRSSFLNWLGD